MTSHRISTTHAGSLPRPENVLHMLRAKEGGVLFDVAANGALLEEAVRDAVDGQIASGIDLVSDGALARPSYATYVLDRLTGFGGEGPLPVPANLAEYPEYEKRLFGDQAVATPKNTSCTAPIVYWDTNALAADLARFGRALRGRRQGFLTAASPGAISGLRNEYYPTREAYLGALADALRTEYHAIHDAGFVLQIDCPDFGMVGHADTTLKELRRSLALHVEVLNHAVADIPPEHMRIHLCWGNYERPHHRDVPLEDVVDIVLTARPSGISFPAASPRHAHVWKMWEELGVPDGKVLVPGVLDSTTSFIEHPELVAERILRFARIVGADRVIAGADCGLSTFAGLRLVDPAIAWAKLGALAEGARIATRRLRQVARPPLTASHA